nr:hypothetical protein [Methylococcus geothermalis]
MSREIRLLVAEKAWKAADRYLQVDGTECLQPGIRLLEPFSGKFGLWKRTPIQAFEPGVAFDHPTASLREQIGKTTGQHDFIADSLFGVDQQVSSGEVLSLPFGKREPVTRKLRRQPPVFLFLPAFAETSGRKQQVSFGQMNITGFGLQFQCPIEVCQRLDDVTEVLMQDADIGMSQCEPGFQRYGAFKHRQRLARSSQISQQESAIMHGVREVGLEFQGPPETGEGFFQVAFPLQGDSQIAPGIGVRAVRGQYRTEAGLRPCAVVQIQPDDPDTVVGFQVEARGAFCPVQAFRGLRQAPLSEPDPGEMKIGKSRLRPQVQNFLAAGFREDEIALRQAFLGLLIKLRHRRFVGIGGFLPTDRGRAHAREGKCAGSRFMRPLRSVREAKILE